MVAKRLKPLLVAAFSLGILFFSNISKAQEDIPGTPEVDHKGKKEELNPAEIILEHVADGHEFHFATIGHKHVTLPLPVILYSSGKGLSVFMSSAFHHGEHAHEGYMLLNKEFIEKNKLDEVKNEKGDPVFKAGKIYAVDASGKPDLQVKVYDFSITRNVFQMLVSVLLLILIMTRIAKKYKSGTGVNTAPTGFQNAIEPVITFIRDDVARPNLGHAYVKYMPLLLTIFFFILLNNLIGLVPGVANVTGNIAFTAMLGIISFIVILISTNKHYWAHIFWPPVPHPVKIIMVPVEIMGIFTKPFALIIRLFANMISGHIIILSFICLIFIFGAMNTALGWGSSLFFVPLAIFIYLLEILVAFIQAYIFANLTAVFIGQAFEGGHDHDDVPGHADPVVI
jgi:F-type H+-transporting ATPase subunit a